MLVEAVADEGADCHAGDFEGLVLEVDADGLVFGIGAVGVEFNVSVGLADVAFEGDFVLEAGDDNFAVLCDWAALDGDDGT